MKSKKRIIVALILAVLLLSIPFDTRTKDIKSAQHEGVYTCYRSVLWQYNYTCLGIYNNGSWRMEKKVTLLGCIPIYERIEYMQVDFEGELIPWVEGYMVTEI